MISAANTRSQKYLVDAMKGASGTSIWEQIADIILNYI